MLNPLLLAAGLILVSTGQTFSVPAESIRSVTLERGCFGCDAEGTLMFSADGVLVRTAPAPPRINAPARRDTAVVGAAAFRDLARVVIENGFLQLADQYRN